MNFTFSNLEKKDSINHKTIARQGIHINRNPNEGVQVSPSGDKPFFEELTQNLHMIPFIP